jgi:predicted AlkP superfamily pyrophosphatase or phosphodiesterase
VTGDGQTVPPADPSLFGIPEVTEAFDELINRSPINHVIVLVMDALGYDQLVSQFRKGEAPYLAAAAHNPRNFFAPFTSVYPSTTTTALTSLATARPPQEHGIMGTTNYFPNVALSVNLIHFSHAYDHTITVSEKMVNPDTLLPVPNVYTLCDNEEIPTQQVNYYAFRNSSISRFCSANSRSKYVPYITPAGCFTALRQVLETTTAEKSYTYAYVSTIDSTAHTYGALSEYYEAELANLDFSLQREFFGKIERPDTLLILTADHGQIIGDTDNRTVWLHEHPELTRLLVAPLGGEGRAPYLYLKHGTEIAEKARNYIKTHFGENFLVLSKAEALAAGLFGDPEKPPFDECADRIGDLVLCARNGWQIRQSVNSTERYLQPLGVHGGLARAEMLVPFLAMRLG